MEITKIQSGEFLEVRIRGRLDGYWAEDLSKNLQESIREGAHHLRLDLAGIDYISSIGLGVLLHIYRLLTDIHGSFCVINPSKTAHKLLMLSGVDHLLLGDSQIQNVVHSAAAQECRRIERDHAEFEIFELDSTAKLHYRCVGNAELFQRFRFREEHCQTITLPNSSIAVGLGALGDTFDDCRTRFGEFLAVCGSIAYQPTDGSNVPDHMTSKGSFIPSVQMLYGIVCEGKFANVFHFQQKTDSGAVTLSDLTEVCLEITGSNAIGMTIVAESAGLLGAWLRRSPAIDDGSASPFSYPGVRERMSFAAERIFHRSMIVVTGIAVRSEHPMLQSLVRPLWREPYPAGHFHAASFTYRPLKKRVSDLQKVVTTLFEEETLQGVLHLLSDDREAEGTGQSEFVRGACWVAPLEETA